MMIVSHPQSLYVCSLQWARDVSPDKMCINNDLYYYYYTYKYVYYYNFICNGDNCIYFGIASTSNTVLYKTVRTFTGF